MNVRIYLLLTFLFVFSMGFSQNIEDFLRPYADKIVENTSFEFNDKETNQKFRSTEKLPIKENLEIESEYLHWSYTSALAYDGLYELGRAIDEKSYVNFTKDAFAFFFSNKDYYSKVKEKGFAIDGLKSFMRFKGVWDDGALTAAMLNIYQDEELPSQYMDYLNEVAKFFFDKEKKDANAANKKKREEKCGPDLHQRSFYGSNGNLNW